jgi:hypothetical protein
MSEWLFSGTKLFVIFKFFCVFMGLLWASFGVSIIVGNLFYKLTPEEQAEEDQAQIIYLRDLCGERKK